MSVYIYIHTYIYIYAHGKVNLPNPTWQLTRRTIFFNPDLLPLTRLCPQERLPTRSAVGPTALLRCFQPMGRSVVFVGIAGASGCGKTTLARKLAEALQSPLEATKKTGSYSIFQNFQGFGDEEAWV